MRIVPERRKGLLIGLVLGVPGLAILAAHWSGILWIRGMPAAIGYSLLVIACGGTVISHAAALAGRTDRSETILDDVLFIANAGIAACVLAALIGDVVRYSWRLAPFFFYLPAALLAWALRDGPARIVPAVLSISVAAAVGWASIRRVDERLEPDESAIQRAAQEKREIQELRDIVSALLHYSAAPWGEPRDGIAWRITPGKASYFRGDPVRFFVHGRNTGSRPVTASIQEIYEGIRMIGPGGELSRKAEEGFDIGYASQELGQGEIACFEFHPPFDLSAPGAYTVLAPGCPAVAMRIQ